MNNLKKVIDRIASEDLEKLKDPSYLEFKLLPELGLNDRHMNQYPSSLHKYCGIGIDSWQYPNQFSKYLCYLSQLDIKNYVEIGCHKGGTFIITVEYLNRFNKIESALAIDNWPREIINSYCEYRDNVIYLTDSSQSDSFKTEFYKKRWDLVLIDGDHGYQAVKKDFEIVNGNSNYIAFHDIRNVFCPGTQQIWHDIKNTYNNFKFNEWSDQYDEVLLRLRGSIMGIGLVETI